MSNEKPYFGWYSSKQKARNGYSEYKAVDGKTIFATMISETGQHGAFWDDIEFVGMVVSQGSSHWINKES